MLAPVPDRRPTGKSSFRKLQSYLREVMDPETGELRERGEMFLSPALLSAETAAKEMWAVAAENQRVKDPVEHFILSWQEGEQPSREQWQEAVTHALEALGWKEHQWLAVSHTDTDNFHVHIMVNKVHPETYRSHTPAWMHKTLDKCCREIEAKQGWQHSNGLYRWDADARQAVPVSREERERRKEAAEAERLHRGAAGTGKAEKMEQFRDAESLETYCKGEPARSLDAAMKRSGATWQDVHAALAKYGLELRKSDRGGYVVRAVSEDGQEVHAKASKVFRKHFAGKEQRAATEAKLGDWRPPKAYVKDVAPTEQRYSRHRELKRDPDKRQAQREDRARERAALKARFQGYKVDFFARRAEARKAERERAKGQFQVLAAEARAKRQEIREADMPPALRKVARSIVAAEAMQARERLKVQLAQERRDAEDRPHDYRSWVQLQASLGDKAAASQLRGWAYQERRKAHGAAEIEAQGRPAQRPADPRQMPQEKAVALRMTWQADTRAGTVDYFLDGEKAFTDYGQKVSFAKDESKRDELEAGLRLALAKFGPDIHLRGSDEYKAQMVQIAAETGLRVQFSDPVLQAHYEQRRESLKAGGLAKPEPQASKERERPNSPTPQRDQDGHER